MNFMDLIPLTRGFEQITSAGANTAILSGTSDTFIDKSVPSSSCKLLNSSALVLEGHGMFSASSRLWMW